MPTNLPEAMCASISAMRHLVRHPTRLCRFSGAPVLKDFPQIDDPGGQFEEVLHLSNARVVLADMEALQNDFPELQEARLLKDEPRWSQAGEQERQCAVRRLIEQWLLRRAAVVSMAQTREAGVNTGIPTEGPVDRAYRPTRYGRALVVRSDDEPAMPAADRAGLLEVKGAGVAPGQIPGRELHRSGLMQLGEALQDTAMQWVIEAVFWHANSSFSAVPLYAVIDAGFDVYTTDGRPVPAALQVRRAHRRPEFSNELPEPGSAQETLKAEVEMLLRQYGITSCKNGTTLEIAQENGQLRLQYGGRSVHLPDDPTRTILRILAGISCDWTLRASLEGINIQFTRDVDAHHSRAELIDFGQYTFRDRFRLPALNLVRHRPMMWGAALFPESPHYAQPNPDLSVPASHWPGEKPWNLAASFRAREITGDEVLAQITAFLEQVAEKWLLQYDPRAPGCRDWIERGEGECADRARRAALAFSSESRRLQTLIDEFKRHLYNLQ